MKDKSFKQLEEELSAILERIEHAEYDELDDLLDDYKAGKELIAELESRLESATVEVNNIMKKEQ